MESFLDWAVEPMTGFETARPIVPGSTTAYVMELLVQLRSTGRMLDNFRTVVDGSSPLECELDMATIIPSPAFKGWRLNFQYWARDIAIRRNVTTSAWMDVPALICSNQAEVLDANGTGIPSAEFMQRLEDLPDDGPESGSLRWAIIIGEDDRPRLQLQALPCDAVSLSGKPATKG